MFFTVKKGTDGQLNYRVNLIPDEYINKQRFWFIGSPMAFIILAAIILLIYSFFRISTYNLDKEIEIYRQSAGKAGMPVLKAGEIRQELEKYQGRLKVINAVGGATTPAGIAELLFNKTPAGTVLTGIEITCPGGEQSPSGVGKVTIEGELPSIELVGLYLSDIDSLPGIKEALAANIKYNGYKATFTINAEMDITGAEK